MKKFIVIFLTLSLILGTPTIAFAEGNDTSSQTSQNTNLTPDQQQDRDSFLKVYFDYMNQLVALRQQTIDAQNANNTIVKQIRDKLKSKTVLNSDTVSKLKDLANQRKALIDQAKQLHQQRLTLRDQYKDAVKARDLNKMQSIEQQILDLNSQINDLKAKDDSIKAQIAPLRDQLKSMTDQNKQLKDSIKSQLDQAKSILQTIKTQEQEKAQLWNTYKDNIKNKDYSNAEATFKAIIDKKSAILTNIKERGTILNQILSSLN